MTKRIVTAAMVLAVLLAGLAALPAQKVLAGSASNPVILVHGWNANSVISCDYGPEFGDIETYFHNHGISNTVSVGFYNSDFNCGYYLQDQSSHCAGWYDSGSNDGTVNEDIRHTTCLLAWYIWNYYTSAGKTVEVVAHSMGGILIRQAMFDTPYVPDFPPYLKISDVVTAGTPHQGLNPGTAFGASSPFFGCASPCTEVYQMEDNNGLIVNLNSTAFRSGFGRNPQGNGGTDWTNMSSGYDFVMYGVGSLGAETMGCAYNRCDAMAVGWMPGAKHFIGYPGWDYYPSYQHGDYLTDSNTAWNAFEDWSDNNGGTWSSAADSEHSIYSMYEAVLLSTW